MSWENKTAKQKYEHLLTRILWGLQKTNMTKSQTESTYNRGYRLGFNEAKKLGISLVERAIEELKKGG